MGDSPQKFAGPSSRGAGILDFSQTGIYSWYDCEDPYLKNETIGSPIAYIFKDPSSHSKSSIGDLNVEPGEETGCLIPYYQEERGIEKKFSKKT